MSSQHQHFTTSTRACPGGQTLNDYWLVSERSRIQTQGLQTLFLPISLQSNPRYTSELRSTSPGGQAGRAHNAQNSKGLTASGYVQAVVRLPVITPNGIRFSSFFLYTCDLTMSIEEVEDQHWKKSVADLEKDLMRVGGQPECIYLIRYNMPGIGEVEFRL